MTARRTESDAQRRTLDALRALVLVSDTRRQVVAGVNGIGLSDMTALSHLHAVGPTGPTELAQAVGITSSSTTALVDRLERLGMVTRERHEGDRRRSVIAITPRGTQFVRSVRHEFSRALEAIPSDELPSIATSLERVAAALVATHENAPIRI